MMRLNHVLRIIELGTMFLFELGRSSVAVARAALSPRHRISSAILAVPIELRTDLGIATLANLVTLTPGTCSLHVSRDRRILFVHVLDAPSPERVIASIRTTFEQRIAKVER